MRVRWALLFLLTGGGVRAQDPPPGLEDLKKTARRLQTLLEERTGLKFQKEVGIGVYSKDELRNMILREFRANMTPAQAEDWKKIGYRFGFYPRDLNLMDVHTEILTESIAGFYHPITKELKLVADGDPPTPQEKAEEKLLGVRMADVYLYHELFHALQDQHFGLDGLRAGDDGNSDRVAAITSVIEGEATYLHNRFKYGEYYGKIRHELGREPADPPKKSFPRFLYKSLYFPYTVGLRFMDRCFRDLQLSHAGPLFADPPLSTEQILHPEKYIGPRDYPTLIRFPLGRWKKILGGGWRRLGQDVLGEYGIRIMFEDQRMRRIGHRAAAGWDGDRFVAYEREADGRILLIWLTTWDSEGDAAEFASAYKELLEKKYTEIRPLAGEEGTAEFWSTPEGQAVVELKGKDVLILEGADDEERGFREIVWNTAARVEMKRFERIRAEYY